MVARPQQRMAFGGGGGLTTSLVPAPHNIMCHVCVASGDIYFGTDVEKWGAKGAGNHLEERLLAQAQVRASYTPPFLKSFA